jgi:2-polyprenyl-3-methyl-5-hydroxy-6-metoxy-1,4-benzoquinol methylase/Zn ribbon nucleic-acid-binding protein
MTRIREEDLRPKESMRGQQEALRADIAFLVSRRSEFVAVDCPACGSSDCEPLWEKNGLVYEKCVACDTGYMTPRPSEALLLDFYEHSQNYAYWNEHVFPASEDARRERIVIPRADRLESILNALGRRGGAMLEIGSGFGTFADEMRSRGIHDRVVALEMTPALARTCRERGLEVLECPIESLEIPEQSFDLIVSFEVIEHVFSPGFFLAAARRLLRPSGLLVLSCPNREGFDVLTLGAVSDTVDHEHLNYFNPRSIRLMLTACGLRVHEVTTPGELDADIVRNKILDGTYDIAHFPFLRHVLIDHWEAYGGHFQTHLREAGLSSHMWVVAQKT